MTKPAPRSLMPGALLAGLTALTATVAADAPGLQDEHDAIEQGMELFDKLLEYAMVAGAAVAGGIMGVAALVAIVSSGNPERRSRAFSWVGWSAVGLLVLLFIPYIIRTIQNTVA